MCHPRGRRTKPPAPVCLTLALKSKRAFELTEPCHLSSELLELSPEWPPAVQGVRDASTLVLQRRTEHQLPHGAPPSHTLHRAGWRVSRRSLPLAGLWMTTSDPLYPLKDSWFLPRSYLTPPAPNAEKTCCSRRQIIDFLVAVSREALSLLLRSARVADRWRLQRGDKQPEPEAQFCPS